MSSSARLIRKDYSDSIEITAECLSEGKIAVLPTDTVYGFSGIAHVLSHADLQDTDRRIKSIKGRDENKPLIQLLSCVEDVEKYSSVPVPETVRKFWPGPLTVILPVKPGIYCDDIKTVAFRVPGDPWIREVISRCKAPVYSTSVNRSGKPVLDEIKAIVNEFSSEVDLIVADGDRKNALPSTIVMISNGEVKVLRQGAVDIK